jgi:hypothetical protein
MLTSDCCWLDHRLHLIALHLVGVCLHISQYLASQQQV